MHAGSLIASTMLLLAALLPARAIAGGGMPIPSFIEEAKTAGVVAQYDGDWEYMVGGGVGTFDCNGDMLPDMAVAGGTSPASFFRNVSKRGAGLRFEREASGLELDGVTAIYPLDIDSDRNVDIVLLRVGENVVMRGLGNCRFARANEQWGFDGGDAWSAAFAATFERGSSWPTLAVGNYIDRKEESFPWGSCTDNWLHRPGEAGKFAPPLALKPSHCALSMLFTDWNRSGTPSLRVSNDREYYKGGQEQMWKIEPGKPPVLYTEAEGWRYVRIWGMGIAGYDLDFDGYPEYFLTSMADNRLQKLADVPADGKLRPSYKEIAWPLGITAHRPHVGDDLRPSTAWHTQFEDVNNDGRADLFIAKGNVDRMPDFAARDPNNLLLQKEDGKFLEASVEAGVATGGISRGGAVVDLNLDGLLDIAVVNRRENVELFRNVSNNSGRWVQFRLRQEGVNPDAIGAWVEVRSGGKVQNREIFSGGGHASGQNGWWHFGLGDAPSAEVRVIWPDGTKGDWETVEGNDFYVIERSGRPTAWRPG
jgi:hypothetical protein